MTIDEAIEHAKHVAETCDNAECALEHRQLAEWLSSYDAMSSRAAMYRYLYLRWRDDCETLKAENEKLRELAYKAWKAAGKLCLAFEGPCSGDNGLHDPCPMGERDGECIYGQLRDEMRELGIEMDDE